MIIIKKKICIYLTILKIKILIILFSFSLWIIRNKIKKIKIGVIGLKHGDNIGNNLLKYAMDIKLKELGFDPYIIGMQWKNTNISFIINAVKLRIIKFNFSEIKKNDYDILMVNSDQTWIKRDKHFYDHAFLNFAKNWNITKFIYGASLGHDHWILTKKDEKIAKDNLKNFKSISFREKGTIKLVINHLGFKSTFVLDPTLLIDKKYYLNIIKNYKENINFKNNYIFTYLIYRNKKVNEFINKVTSALNFKIYNVKKTSRDSIKRFIFGIINSKSVITDSYHGTLFSIIFNKPFLLIKIVTKKGLFL